MSGKRLYLTKIKEEKDSDLVNQLRRKGCCPVDESYKKDNDSSSILR